ncbi:polyprenyl diphosphate synthase [Chloroflexota bacterium]
MEQQKRIDPLPQHVAIIMDGNGRWAQGRGLSRTEGHRAGVENIRRVIEACAGYRIGYLTLYTFSTENWNRPKSEVMSLLKILREMIDPETKALHENSIRIRHLGRMEGISRAVQAKIRRAVKLTRDNTGMTVSFAFNYGGRVEIIDAVRGMIRDGVRPADIDEKTFAGYLYTDGLPEVDLVIRTGGEIRLSNYLVWQTAYSELYFTPVLWPDFGREEVEKALTAYSRRDRRFGGLSPETIKASSVPRRRA